MGRMLLVLLLVGCAAEPTLAVDDPCELDEECIDGFCYGHVTPLGTFTESVCHSRCIDVRDTSHFCRRDAHCCEGYRCCEGEGCGEGSGSCIPSR